MPHVDLNLVYRTKLLRNMGRKLREEGIKIGYHIFVALQNLNNSQSVRQTFTITTLGRLPAGKSSEYHGSPPG